MLIQISLLCLVESILLNRFWSVEGSGIVYLTWWAQQPILDCDLMRLWRLCRTIVSKRSKKVFCDFQECQRGLSTAKWCFMSPLSGNILYYVSAIPYSMPCWSSSIRIVTGSIWWFWRNISIVIRYRMLHSMIIGGVDLENRSTLKSALEWTTFWYSFDFLYHLKSCYASCSSEWQYWPLSRNSIRSHEHEIK